MCVLCLKSWQAQYNLIYFFFNLRREKSVYVLSNQVDHMIFNIFTKMPLKKNVVWKLKTSKMNFLNLVFKMSNVTQTLQ